MDVKSNFIFFQKQNRAQPPRPKYPSASFAVSLFRMHTPARAWYSTLSLTLCISLGLTTFASHFFHPRKTVSSASSVFYFYQTAYSHNGSFIPPRLCDSARVFKTTRTQNSSCQLTLTRVTVYRFWIYDFRFWKP